MTKRLNIRCIVWSVIILSGASVWFVINLYIGTNRYEQLRSLFDEKNKTWIKPVDLVDLGLILQQPDHYINETSAIKRLYESIATINLLYGIPNDHVYSRREDCIIAGQPKSNITECIEQTNWIMQQLKERNNYYEQTGLEAFEMTNFMDSYGRPGAGIFADYNDAWTGLYEKCQIASLRHGQIRGRYCLSRFRFTSWPPPPSRIEPEPALRIGVCLPDACDSLSIESRVMNETISWLAKFQIDERLRNQIELRSLFCLPDEESPLRKITWQSKLFLSLIIAWFALFVIINCFYELCWRRAIKTDNRKESSRTMRITQAFTLRNSMKSFTTSRKSPCDTCVDTSMLEFVKLMMAFAVIVSHSLVLSVYQNRTRRGALDLGVSNTAKFVTSFGRFVDTFLILFGLTLSYSLLQKFGIKRLRSPSVWIITNLAIFLRIAPIHALILNFNKWITPHLGSGPWWDYGVSEYSHRYSCRFSSWLDSIPFKANLGIFPVPTCNPPAWFLGPYSQFALVIPILTYVIGDSGRKSHGVILVLLISFISSANVAWKLYRQQVVQSNVIGDYGAFMVAIVEKIESTGYMDSLGRFGSVAIGVYSGYLLHLYKEGKIKKWPSWFASRLFNMIILLVHVALFVLPVYGKAIFSPNTPSSMTKLQFATINLFMIPLWPIINCILIISACTTYKRHPIVRFMAHPVWSAAGKLGFAIYLIHFEVLIVSLTYSESAQSGGHDFDVFRLAGFGIILTTLLAIVVYLVFEAPLAYFHAKLFKTIHRRVKQRDYDMPSELSIKQSKNDVTIAVQEVTD